MPKKMGNLRSIVRSCVPIMGIAVMVVLCDEPKLFLTILLLPLAIALPLIVWSTIKIASQVAIKQLIDWKYIILYGFSLIVLAAGACLFFMLDAALSHGAVPFELFLNRCLFAFTVIVAYPAVDLILWRYSLVSGTETLGKIRTATILAAVTFCVVAALLLVQIIGPPVNAALKLNYRNIAKMLINLGADPHKRDRSGGNPLWYAVHRVDLEMTTLLLDKGAKLDKYVAGLGLRRAVENHNTDMLRLLLARGASPDSTYMGSTPLAYACLTKDVPMIKMLVDSGADINFKCHYPNTPYDGKSPLDIANESGDSQMVELLLRRGKDR